jgi:hypothetical protein
MSELRGSFALFILYVCVAFYGAAAELAESSFLGSSSAHSSHSPMVRRKSCVV